MVHLASTDPNLSRIATLQEMISRDSTPAGERAAAQRLLKRLEAKVKDLRAEAIKRSPYARRYGSKATNKPAPVTEIAKWMRADIALARKLGRTLQRTKNSADAVAIGDPIGDAPDQIKFTVRCEHYTSIYIVIRNIPEEWGWHAITDHPDYRPGTVIYKPTDPLRDLAQALQEIHWSYNYDGSDLQTDYFDRRYYGRVHGVQPDGHENQNVIWRYH